MSKPTVGRIVLFCMHAAQAGEINRRRVAKTGAPTWPPGVQAHVENSVTVGGLAAHVWDDETVNL